MMLMVQTGGRERKPSGGEEGVGQAGAKDGPEVRPQRGERKPEVNDGLART